MKKTLLGSIAVLGIALLMFTSCDKLPEAEIAQAKAAVDSAKTVGADIYLKEAFSGLQDSMKVIDAKVAEQESKWFKNYSEVRTKLATATTLANDLVTKTEVRKTELKAEIEQVYAEVKALIEEDNNLVKKAPRGKGGAAIIEEIKTDIATTTEWIETAHTDIKEMELLIVLDKMKAAKEKATAIQTELNDAIAKKAGKK